MSNNEVRAMQGRVRLTVLITAAWLILMLCWIALASSHYSFFQNLICLGIATLLYGAVTGVLWVVDQGFVLAATVLTTLGWLSFTLYWIGFGWSGHTFLQNSAILVLSLVAWVGVSAWLWVGQPSNQAC
jgi:hypothetical protein